MDCSELIGRTLRHLRGNLTVSSRLVSGHGDYIGSTFQVGLGVLASRSSAPRSPVFNVFK